MSDWSIQTEDGARLRVMDTGPRDARILIVIHPGGGGAEVYDAVTRHLATELRVVRIRRRRYVHGAAVVWDMHREALGVLAVDAAMNSDRPVHLFGHSSGAVAALEAALTDPSQFAEVIAYEPPMPTSDLVAGAAGARAHHALDADDPVEAMRIHLRDIAQIEASFLDDLPHEEIGDAFGSAVAAQLADNDAIDALGVGIDRYANLNLPVFFIQGETSPAHLHRRITELADVLPSADIVTLATQGHVAHLTAPAELAAQIGRLVHRDA